jgi:ubiquinone/menaquinone biosynthesis C-methylase UbiE
MQYAKDFTDALQFMWGEGFLSPGGHEEVDDMLDGHNIAGKRVLDIGSGLGGVDAYLVKKHGAAEVIGIDVEEQLVDASRALIADRGLSDNIRFMLVEAGPFPFSDNSFDMVFTKDAMVHIPDKAALYREVWRVLVPGGHFIAADWLWAEGAESSPVVQSWLSNAPLKFAFTTPTEASVALRQAGFLDAVVTDRRYLLQASNREEIETLEGPARQKLAAIVGEEMALSRLASARGRQRALDSGNLIPSHFKGQKPVA